MVNKENKGERVTIRERGKTAERDEEEHREKKRERERERESIR